MASLLTDISNVISAGQSQSTTNAAAGASSPVRLIDYKGMLVNYQSVLKELVVKLTALKNVTDTSGDANTLSVINNHLSVIGT